MASCSFRPDISARFATREALAARLLESMEDLGERFLTREPRAAVPYEWAERLCKRFATHEPRAECLSGCVGHLCVRFATREPLAAVLFEFVEALHEWRHALCLRFATQEPLAALLHEGREALRERFATQEPLAARVYAKIARIANFSALEDPLADTLGELPQVLRDLLPVASELRRVLVSFFDDLGKILEVRLPIQARPGVDPGSQDDPREDAAPVPETLEGPGAQPEEIAADAARK